MFGRIIEYISVFLAILIVIPLHELAHGFVAGWCGDPTPKLNDRMTINPMAHIDLVGAISFVLVGFGWSKPMPTNPYNFRNYKRDSFFVAIAGIVMDYLIAFISIPIFWSLVLYIFPIVGDLGLFDDVIVGVFSHTYSISLGFMAINLLPFYPYDCFRAIDAFATKRGAFFKFLRDKGIYIMYGLFALSFFADISGLYFLDILGNYMSFTSAILGIPINAFWGLFI
ncbi:MAG: site-2 protease family protein [Clostridia bacterium]|nr:site-2 protease family protein [Clostridia bacterium]